MQGMSWTVAALWLVGCAQAPEPAPDDLDGLTRYLFRHYDDDAALGEAVDKLAVILDTQGRDDGLDGWRIENLAEEDTQLIEHPNGPLADMLGVAVTHVSRHPISVHGRSVLEDDQKWLDPKGYVTYDRRFVAGQAEFSNHTAGLETHNTIEKSGGFGIVIPFESTRGFTWASGTETDALIGVGGMTNEACSDNGKNCILQSFALEVFIPDGDETLRLNAVWGTVITEVDSLITDETKYKLSIKGVQSVFEHTDDHLDD
jgi:hypothetical protein